MKFLRTLFLLLLASFVPPLLAQNMQQMNSTGSITTANTTCNFSNSTSCVVLPLYKSAASVSIGISGPFSGTLYFQSSVDGKNYSAFSVTPVGGGSAVTSTTAPGSWNACLNSLAIVNVAGQSIASGSATVTIQASTGSCTVNSGGGISMCPGAGGTVNAFLVDSGTQGTCTDSSVLAGGSPGTFLYNGFTNALPGTSGTLLNAVPTQYSEGQCPLVFGDGVTAPAMATYPTSGSLLQCPNNGPHATTWTIASIRCYSDSGAVTMDVKNDAGTSLLTGPVTCGSTKTSGGTAGTLSATTTIAATDGINMVLVMDGSALQVTGTVNYTY